MTVSRSFFHKILATISQNRSKTSAALIFLAGLGFYFYREEIKFFFKPAKSLDSKESQAPRPPTQEDPSSDWIQC